jgi:eukaryotic-like serine/threonine-protein kinase
MSLTIEQLRALDELVQTGLDQSVATRRAWFDALTIESPELKPLLKHALFPERNVESGTFMGTVPKIAREIRGVSDLSPGERVGPYRLEALIGEGGSASVWRARQDDGKMRRTVALKLPYFVGNTRGWSERIERERDVLASLNHPNVATIYDAGIAENGRPWLALELIDGARIDHYARENKLTGDDLVRLFLPAVRAIEHAHARGVIHRDVKPQNILVAENDRNEAQLKLLDFGIAKLQNDFANQQSGDSELTRIHGLPFTPEYASLEQLRGETITTATDIYSLGVVFYELLCGERPFAKGGDAASLRKLEQRIAAGIPVRPSQLVKRTTASVGASSVSPDLDAMALKALHNDDAKRYQTASAFADDLERFLKRETVSAQADSSLYRARQFVKRNRLMVAASAGVAVSLVGGLGIALWQAQEAQGQRAFAQLEAQRATAALTDAQQQRAAANQSSARADENAATAQREALLSKANATRAESQAQIAAEQRRLAQSSERLANTQLERAEQETRAKRLEAEKANAIKNFLTSLLKANEIDKVGAKQKREQSVEQLLQGAAANIVANLDDQLDVKIELLSTIAGLLADLGMYTDAKTVLERQLAILRSSGVGTEVSIAKSMLQLSRIESNLGNQKTAIALATPVIEGSTSGKTLEASKLRIQALAERSGQLSGSDTKAALADASLAVELSEKYANDTAEQVSGLSALSLAYSMRGQSAESSKAMERAIRVSGVVYGPSSVRTASLQHRWSELLFRQREVEKAIEQINLAIVAFKGEFGNDGYLTARASVWAGRLRGATGEFSSAVSLLTKGIESLEKIRDRIDPQQIALPKTWTAYTYLENGQIEPARLWAEAATKYYPHSSAERSAVPYINTQIGLGIYHFHAGDYKAAREIYYRIDQFMLKLGLKDNPERWVTANRRALCSLYLGEVEEAKKIAAEILEAHTNAPKTHGSPATAALTTLALAELTLGQITNAKVHIETVEARLRAIAPNERKLAYLQDYAQLLIQGAVALEEARIDDSYMLFSRALELLENRQHPDSVFTANARSHLAMAATRKGEQVLAASLLDQAKRAFDAQSLHAPHFRAAYEKAIQRVSR